MLGAEGSLTGDMLGTIVASTKSSLPPVGGPNGVDVVVGNKIVLGAAGAGLGVGREFSVETKLEFCPGAKHAGSAMASVMLYMESSNDSAASV